MVDYRERSYAKGKIPSTFTRREGAPKEREILAMRVIDRATRAVVPEDAWEGDHGAVRGDGERRRGGSGGVGGEWGERGVDGVEHTVADPSGRFAAVVKGGDGSAAAAASRRSSSHLRMRW